MTSIHCLHTRRKGKWYKCKLLHPEPVLSIATSWYPEWFSIPISKTVLFFSELVGFLSKNSGGGLAASHSRITAQIRKPGHGSSPHAWACTDCVLQRLPSPVSNSALWECSCVQSGHTAFTQDFALIKACHMNMQGSKYQERLLAKFIKICEWLCLGTFWQSSSSSPTH